jgi:methionine synthase II (cobalamin-independent)
MTVFSKEEAMEAAKENKTYYNDLRKQDDRIAIAVGVTYKFDEKGSAVSWQTTMPQEATDRAISQVVDKIHKAVGRQIGWIRIHTIDNHLQTLLTQRAQLEYDMKSIEDKNPDMDRISRDAKIAYNTNRENLIRHDILINSLKREKGELLIAFGVKE